MLVAGVSRTGASTHLAARGLPEPPASKTVDAARQHTARRLARARQLRAFGTKLQIDEALLQAELRGLSEESAQLDLRNSVLCD